MNDKEYETSEYVKIFLIVLLSSIFTFYIKTLINPLISSLTSGGTAVKGQLGGGSTQPTANISFKSPVPPASIPMMNGMNFNPTGMQFNMNKPMF